MSKKSRRQITVLLDRGICIAELGAYPDETLAAYIARTTGATIVFEYGSRNRVIVSITIKQARLLRTLFNPICSFYIPNKGDFLERRPAAAGNARDIVIELKPRVSLADIAGDGVSLAQFVGNLSTLEVEPIGLSGSRAIVRVTGDHIVLLKRAFGEWCDFEDAETQLAA